MTMDKNPKSESAEKDSKATGIVRLTGRQKAAIVLVALGPELAARVMKNLDEDEIERLTWEIFNVETVEDEYREAVLEEAYRKATGRDFAAKGGESFARQLLSHSMGSQRAEQMIERLSVPPGLKPFDFLTDADLEQVTTFIQGEHPQVIALILSFLPPRRAARVLSEIDEELQAEVAMRIANMEQAQPEAIRRVEQVLRRRFAGRSQTFAQAGGTGFLVQVLTNVNVETERSVLARLEDVDSKMADEIKNQMFVFGDLIRLDDRSLQRLLRDVDNRDLALAMKDASEGIKERILGNMSSRAADMLRDELVVLGPVLRRVVVEAQQKIVNIVRQLDEDGEILVARRAEDVIV